MTHFQKAFETMPDFFTSRMMTKELRAQGVPESAFGGSKLHDWLRMKAKNTAPRSWVKKQKHQHIENGVSTEITSAILLLKSYGYKIMKPKTEWEEVA